MKIISLVLLMFFTVPLFAEEASSNSVLQKTEKQSAFKGLFYKVWNKFKTMSPKDEKKLVRTGTATAGIRGAETTSTILQPYWKDDKTSDEQFMLQLEGFAQAQTLADRGDLEGANQAFREFVDKWPESDLRPNAQFADALTLGAMGKAAESSQSFKIFVDANPQHPLVEDAKAVMAELQ